MCVDLQNISYVFAIYWNIFDEIISFIDTVLLILSYLFLKPNGFYNKIMPPLLDISHTFPIISVIGQYSTHS